MNAFEYESQGAATFLVYQKSPEDVVDSISMGMISNNVIEGILPFVFVQMDDTVYFKYNVSARNTLEQYFSGMVSRKRLLNVLASVLDAFILSEEYMLEPSAFVLDQSYIFVNPQTSMASLVVLPIVRENEVTMEQFIRQLVFGIRPDQTEDCSYIAALIGFLNSNQFFSIRDFRKLVGDLQKKEAQQPSRSIDIPAKARSVPERREVGFTEVKKVIPEKETAPAKSSNVGTSVLTGVNIPGMEIPNADETPKRSWDPIPEDKPRKKGFFAKRKEKEAEKAAEKVRAKEEKRRKKSEKKSLFGRKREESADKEPYAGFAIPGMNIPDTSANSISPGAISSGNAPELTAGTNGVASLKLDVPEQQLSMRRYQTSQQDFGETVDLRAYSEGTTVLTGTTVLIEKQVMPALINVRTREKFQITKKKITIGKDPMNSDFCIQGNPAVSHNHAVLFFENHQVFLQDSRSTNGTFVNGVRISSETAYGPLEHGASVRLANEEFEFRMHE